MGKSCNFINKFENLFRHKAEFALFLGHVDLQQYIRYQIALGSLFLNRLCQPQGIYGMDQIHLINDIFYFIALQMTDHMPVDILGQEIMFV